MRYEVTLKKSYQPEDDHNEIGPPHGVVETRIILPYESSFLTSVIESGFFNYENENVPSSMILDWLNNYLETLDEVEILRICLTLLRTLQKWLEKESDQEKIQQLIDKLRTPPESI